MTNFVTCDLLDDNPDSQVLDVQAFGVPYRHYGAHACFGGQLVTVKCFEDNSRVKELLNSPAEGKVLVVDGGGSLRCALLGDMIAQSAIDNGWAGVIVYGCVRDAADLATMPIGVYALSAIPRKSTRRGEGQQNLDIDFSGVSICDGDFVYCDTNGAIFSKTALI